MSGIVPSTLVKEESETITASGGSGSTTSNKTFNHRIILIIVTATTATTTFRFEAKEHTSQRVIDADRMLHTNEWVIIKNYPVYNDTIDYNITNASVDEDFTVKIRYV